MKNIKFVLKLIILSFVILISSLLVFGGANGKINLIKQESNAIDEVIIDSDYSDVINGDYRMQAIDLSFDVNIIANISYPVNDSDAIVVLNRTIKTGNNNVRFNY